VAAGVGGDGFAVAGEGETGGQFISHELIVRRLLKGQKSFEKSPNLGRPGVAMIAAGGVEGELSRVPEPSRAQTEEVGAAHVQKLRNRIRIKVATVEGGQGLLDEG
jgi:hypothetical protein